MNKKNLILAGALTIIVAIILLMLLSSNTNIKDAQMQETLKNELDLDIIINLEKYSSEEYDESKLLDVAMQLATKKGLLQEYNDENTYFEYVSKDDLHSVILELTGITVEAPIEIEDFYYLYDSENEYYYCRPSTPSYYKIDQINSLKETKNGYEINCSIIKNVDTEVLKIEDVTIKLTTEPENTIIKYAIDEISF
ncbi:MAG: hypothetical protein IJX99_01955 [Clostridia bacterium]|nr:hypothetical protein [Clostridia bacterium]